MHKIKDFFTKLAGIVPFNLLVLLVNLLLKTLAFILIKFIKFYQYFISPLSAPSCRYYPTCSNYAIEAIKIHGVFKGTYLAVKRILKCNPYFPGGVDKVPDKKPNKPQNSNGA